jgi:starvation-inducible DNA-binding protein
MYRANEEVGDMQATHRESRPGGRSDAIGILTQILADEQILIVKLQSFRWNVVGPSFRELRALFQEQYGILAVRIDEVAERIRAVGGYATGSLAEYLQHTALREHQGRFPSANEMSADLLADHQTVTRYITEALQRQPGNALDFGTVDVLTGLIRDHEKMSWQLRSTQSEGQDEQREQHAGYDEPASLRPRRALDKHDDQRRHCPGVYES